MKSVVLKGILDKLKEKVEIFYKAVDKFIKFIDNIGKNESPIVRSNVHTHLDQVNYNSGIQTGAFQDLVSASRKMAGEYTIKKEGNSSVTINHHSIKVPHCCKGSYYITTTSGSRETFLSNKVTITCSDCGKTLLGI